MLIFKAIFQHLCITFNFNQKKNVRVHKNYMPHKRQLSTQRTKLYYEKIGFDRKQNTITYNNTIKFTYYIFF